MEQISDDLLNGYRMQYENNAALQKVEGRRFLLLQYSID